MTSQERSRQEYRARINKVMDYLEANPDKPADLSVLAGLAHFSPYHFHRIFTFMTGETPGAFLQRTRVEKAARLINKNDGMPLAEVAVMCGFGDASAFSRSFKKHFGISPTEYRLLDQPIYIKEGRRFGKICQEDSNPGQVGTDMNSQFCTVELKNLIIMDAKIEIRQMPELNVVYVRHTGQFNQIKHAYGKLFQWAGPRGLIGPDTRTITVYHDDPSVTSIEKVRQSACITVKGDVATDGEIGKMTIPAGKFAVGHFDFRGEEGFEKAWNTMCHWFTESGYEPGEGNSYELYLGDPAEEGDNPPHFVLDICLPVKPL